MTQLKSRLVPWLSRFANPGARSPARHEWTRFFDNLSRSKEGRQVTLEVVYYVTLMLFALMPLFIAQDARSGSHSSKLFKSTPAASASPAASSAAIASIASIECSCSICDQEGRSHRGDLNQFPKSVPFLLLFPS